MNRKEREVKVIVWIAFAAILIASIFAIVAPTTMAGTNGGFSPDEEPSSSIRIYGDVQPQGNAPEQYIHYKDSFDPTVIPTDSITYNPAIIEESREPGELYYGIIIGKGSSSENAREKIFLRSWYEPCGRYNGPGEEDTHPTINMEFTYMLLNTLYLPITGTAPNTHFLVPTCEIDTQTGLGAWSGAKDTNLTSLASISGPAVAPSGETVLGEIRLEKRLALPEGDKVQFFDHTVELTNITASGEFVIKVAYAGNAQDDSEKGEVSLEDGETIYFDRHNNEYTTANHDGATGHIRTWYVSRDTNFTIVGKELHWSDVFYVDAVRYEVTAVEVVDAEDGDGVVDAFKYITLRTKLPKGVDTVRDESVVSSQYIDCIEPAELIPLLPPFNMNHDMVDDIDIPLWTSTSEERDWTRPDYAGTELDPDGDGNWIADDVNERVIDNVDPLELTYIAGEVEERYSTNLLEKLREDWVGEGGLITESWTKFDIQSLPDQYTEFVLPALPDYYTIPIAGDWPVALDGDYLITTSWIAPQATGDLYDNKRGTIPGDHTEQRVAFSYDPKDGEDGNDLCAYCDDELKMGTLKIYGNGSDSTFGITNSCNIEQYENWEEPFNPTAIRTASITFDAAILQHSLEYPMKAQNENVDLKEYLRVWYVPEYEFYGWHEMIRLAPAIVIETTYMLIDSQDKKPWHADVGSWFPFPIVSDPTTDQIGLDSFENPGVESVRENLVRLASLSCNPDDINEGLLPKTTNGTIRIEKTYTMEEGDEVQFIDHSLLFNGYDISGSYPGITLSYCGNTVADAINAYYLTNNNNTFFDRYSYPGSYTPTHPDVTWYARYEGRLNDTDKARITVGKELQRGDIFYVDGVRYEIPAIEVLDHDGDRQNGCEMFKYITLRTPLPKYLGDGEYTLGQHYLSCADSQWLTRLEICNPLPVLPPMNMDHELVDDTDVVLWQPLKLLDKWPYGNIETGNAGTEYFPCAERYLTMQYPPAAWLEYFRAVPIDTDGDMSTNIPSDWQLWDDYGGPFYPGDVTVAVPDGWQCCECGIPMPLPDGFTIFDIEHWIANDVDERIIGPVDPLQFCWKEERPEPRYSTNLLEILHEDGLIESWTKFDIRTIPDEYTRFKMYEIPSLNPEVYVGGEYQVTFEPDIRFDPLSLARPGCSLITTSFFAPNAKGDLNREHSYSVRDRFAFTFNPAEGTGIYMNKDPEYNIVSAIHDLNATTGNIWINWTWKNPAYGAFNHTMIYINNAFITNTSDTNYNLTNLLPGTTHTLSTRTVSTEGVLCEKWMNDTTSTTGALSGGLFPTIVEPTFYSFHSVGDTIKFNVSVMDSTGTTVTSNVSVYVNLVSPNGTSKHLVLSNEGNNFLGQYTINNDDARGLWTVDIISYDATSSGQTSIKVFFIGAYFIQPYTDPRSYILGETVDFTAKVRKLGNVLLTDQNVSLNLSVYSLNGSTLVLGPTAMVFNDTSGLFRSSIDTSLLGPGLFSVVFCGNDTKGNTETERLSIGVSDDFSIIVGTDKACYDRNESVDFYGTVRFTDGTPIPNINVSLWLGLKGFMRSYTVTTNESGVFGYTFQPFAAEAGNYTVTAVATNMALRRTAENHFTIHGLYLAPPLGTLDMAENSSREIDFILYNLGETALTGIAATVDDLNVYDNVDAAIVTSVPNELQPSESAYITLNVSAGTPVPVETAFFINVTTDQMSDETSELQVNLFSPSPIVVIEPDNIVVGMNRNQTVIKTVTISNIGYGALHNLSLIQPSNNWLRITSNTSVGDLKPSENTSFDIHIHSYNVSIGEYHDAVNITSDNHETVMVDLTVSITDMINGSLLFYVKDELGQNISGANISLIDEVIYQEYTAFTNSTGYALLSDLPIGRYIYEVRSTRNNTLSQLGSVVVEPMDQPKRVNVTLPLSFIEFEWDVIPSTIKDWYRIFLNMTFETDVPVPIIVAFPPYLEYNMNPGDVQNGTLTVANLGIVSLFDVSITTNINENVQFTPIVSNIGELKGNSSVQIPYTIELAANASSCDGFRGIIAIKGNYIHFIDGEEVSRYTGTTVPLVIKTPTCKPPEVGTGTITGTVTDADYGSPIDNATVVAGCYSDDTDNSGSYALTNVTSGTYTITAYKDGYYPNSMTVLVTKDTTTVVNFQLIPITTGTIIGTVTNASDGTPIEDAQVVADGYSDDTNSSGSYTLSDVLTGTHTISASQKRFYTNSTTVLVTKDNTAVVNFQLTPIQEAVVLTGSISGIVTDIDTDDPLSSALVVTNGGFNFTDGSGNYTITDVPIGSNRVIATRMLYHSNSKTVQVSENCTTIVNFQLKKIIIPPIPIPECECINGTPPVIWVYKGIDFGGIIPPTTPSKIFVNNCNEDGTINFSDAYGATINLNLLLGLPTLEIDMGILIPSIISSIIFDKYNINIPPGNLWHNELIPKQIEPNEETMLDVENMDQLFSDLGSFGITLPIPELFAGGVVFLYGPYPKEPLHDCPEIIPLGGMEIKEGAINIVFPPLPDWPDWPGFDLPPLPQGPHWEPPIFTETIHEIVQLSVSQNATMERDAFWAGLGIRNRMPNTSIDNVHVSLHITDVNGSANDKFFIRTPCIEGISDIDGSGSISPLQVAKAQWLIIPKPGAGGVSSQTYNISANIAYNVDGNNFLVTTEQVEILVKPQPQLSLDYYIPSDVIANQPFKLAVKVTNAGYSTAKNFSIETAQPVIYNPSGLLVNFNIIGSALQGEEGTTSLKVNFGDVDPAETEFAWWEMVTTLDGTFTKFTGSYTHSDELGGAETSLIKELNTHIIMREINTSNVTYDFLVDSDTDDIPDWVINSTHGGTTEVYPVEYNVTRWPVLENPVMTVNATKVEDNWIYISVEDPFENNMSILSVVREDGKILSPSNYWMRDGRILIVDDPVAKYTITFDTTTNLCGDVAPCPDCDGTVDMGDVILLLNNVSYPENPRYVLCNDWSGDCRCTGVRDMGDVILLLNNVSYPEVSKYALDCCG